MQIILRKDFREVIPKNYTGIVEYPDESKEWYKEGELHRENGPAKEYINGYRAWYREGNLHREDGPAVEFSSGTREWYKKGILHREDGPARIDVYRGIYWFKEGKKHRIDGPAFISSNGTKYWYVEDKNIDCYEFSLVQKAHGIFIESEIGKYGLLWAKFMTVQGIKELPIIPGMKEDDDLKDLLVKLGI